jgi:hypothetical protein
MRLDDMRMRNELNEGKIANKQSGYVSLLNGIADYVGGMADNKRKNKMNNGV